MKVSDIESINLAFLFTLAQLKFLASVNGIHTRDLARTRLACLLDRHFPKNFLFRQAKVSIKNCSILTFWG